MIRQIFRENVKRENPAAQAIKCMKVGSNRISTAIKPYARKILGVEENIPQDKFEKRVKFLSQKAIKMMAAPEKGKSKAVIEGNNERAEKAMFAVRMASAREDKGFFTKLFDGLKQKRLEKIKQAKQRIEQARIKRAEAKTKAIEEARAKAEADASKEERIQVRLKEFENQVRAEFKARHRNPKNPEEEIKPSGRHIKNGIAEKVKELPKEERKEILAYQEKQAATRKKRREKVHLRQEAQIDRRAERARNSKQSTKSTKSTKSTESTESTKETKLPKVLPKVDGILLKPEETKPEVSNSLDDVNPIQQIRAMRAYVLKNGSSRNPLSKKPKAKTLNEQPKLKISGDRARLRELQAEMGKNN